VNAAARAGMLPRPGLLVLWLPFALIVGPFLLWPAVFGLFASFTNYSPFVQHVRFTGLANYALLFKDVFFGSSFRAIAVFSVVTVPVELLIGFAVAMLLREPFRGRAAVRVILLLPWLVSPVANGVMWHFLYASDSGILNYFTAWLALAPLPSPLGLPRFALPAAMLADIWRTSPLVSFLLLPGLLSVPRSLWEQAAMEGAPAFTVARRIALPWLRPLLLTVGMLLLGWSLGTFDGMLILTGGGPGTATLTPALYSFQKAFETNVWNVGATSAWCIGLVVMLAGAAYLILTRREATA
jgi:trehalose/maltose transport system permease protein